MDGEDEPLGTVAEGGTEEGVLVDVAGAGGCVVDEEVIEYDVSRGDGAGDGPAGVLATGDGWLAADADEAGDGDEELPTACEISAGRSSDELVSATTSERAVAVPLGVAGADSSVSAVAGGAS